MEIVPITITLRELYKGYVNDDENGVVAYGGNLDIRPAFQREFVYKDEQRDAVIETINKGFPLNTMYWSENEDGQTYELLDGQQRTLSALMYIKGDFSIDHKYFHNLTATEQDKFLNYGLTIYVCKGTKEEKLDWFKIVNIAGEELTDQELRNSQYTGPWLYDAKKHFSKRGCPATDSEIKKYLNGSSERQEYLETALKWICYRENIKDVKDYMAIHQHDKNADELWDYFMDVISWVKSLFPNFRKEIMKGLDWGYFYDLYGNVNYNPDELESNINELLADIDVTDKKGICKYLITKEEKYLNLRGFEPDQKWAAYQRQNGRCAICGKPFDFSKMHGDHIIPWHDGGKTSDDNCQMLCSTCNWKKSGS